MSDATTITTIVSIAALAGALLLVGAYELGLKLGWMARDARAKGEIEAVKAEFQERRGQRIDARA